MACEKKRNPDHYSATSRIRMALKSVRGWFTARREIFGRLCQEKLVKNGQKPNYDRLCSLYLNEKLTVCQKMLKTKIYEKFSFLFKTCQLLVTNYPPHKRLISQTSFLPSCFEKLAHFLSSSRVFFLIF